jgi:hypothetical protein
VQSAGLQSRRILVLDQRAQLVQRGTLLLGLQVALLLWCLARRRFSIGWGDLPGPEMDFSV